MNHCTKRDISEGVCRLYKIINSQEIFPDGGGRVTGGHVTSGQSEGGRVVGSGQVTVGQVHSVHGSGSQVGVGHVVVVGH